MRLVFDANVLIAAYISRYGVCAELLRHWLHRHRIYASQAILDDLRDKLTTKSRLQPDHVVEAIRLLKLRLSLFEPADVPPDACRDPDDLAVLGTA